MASFSVLFLGSSFFLLLPTEYPVTLQSMQWLVVVVAGIAVLAAGNWCFNPVKFTGPKRTPE